MSTSTHSGTSDDAQVDGRHREDSDTIALPGHVARSGTLDRLVDTARDDARAAASGNTLRAYTRYCAHYARCRLKGTDPRPPHRR
jgi:hypothetical protein